MECACASAIAIPFLTACKSRMVEFSPYTHYTRAHNSGNQFECAYSLDMKKMVFMKVYDRLDLRCGQLPQQRI
jgi:hypothetical protein